MRRYFVFTFLALAYVHCVFAQDSARTATVTPGPEYRAGVVHRFFFGSLWRDLWLTPIQVPVLDLTHYAGGLTPGKLGGGLQTKSLHFAGADGKEYKFRSIDKDPKKVLITMMHESNVIDAGVLDSLLPESTVAGIMQDLIATSNPCSAIITAPLLNAVGILNAQPKIYLMPDDPKLGKYQKDFGGMLGTIEEKPRGATEDNEGFGGAEKTITTDKLFKKLEDDNNSRVDAIAFLKARLMDVLIGDWDRHVQQWTWELYTDGKRSTYLPIPTDRDQAFCRYEGIVPFYVAQYVPQIEDCSDSYPWLADLTWSGRYLDRRFLSSVEQSVWDSLTTFIMMRITDSVISDAVDGMPEPMHAEEGKNIEHVIKSRRDKLKDAANEYYNNLARCVDIHLSNKSEYAEINRNENNTEVTIFRRDKTTGDKKGDPIYHRTFDADHTGEIRLYLLGGEDQVIIRGNGSSILVRIIGSDGKKEFSDSSDTEGKTILYAEGETQFAGIGDTKINAKSYAESDTESVRWEPSIEDRGHAWWGYPWFGYTTDDGIFIGASATLYNYGFGDTPYQNKMTFHAGYATGASRYRASYLGEFPNILTGTFLILARGSGLEVLNYFGTGNETKFDKGLYTNYFYKVRQIQFAIAPRYDHSFLLNGLNIWGDASVRYFMTDPNSTTDSSFLRMNNPYGIGNLIFTTVGYGLNYDSRDIPAAPTKGVYMAFNVHSTPAIMNNKDAYTKIGGDARIYLSADIFHEVTLGLRLRGEKIFGTYPFFESAFLGGLRDLRGFVRERFAGDASLLGNAELRIGIGYFSILMPGIWGLSIFSDEGRVYASGETSNLWHNSFGGGIWLAPLGRANTISLAVGKSTESLLAYFSTGFTF